MTIGPRDKPYPIILHVDSNTGNPSKLAESNAIYVSSVSAITLSATTVCATNWVGIPGGPGTTDHGALTGLLDNDHPQYVLSATNASLSSLISDHLTSAVHWDANTLDARFLNSSGDSVTGSFYFGNLSAAVFSATTISATNAYIASTIQFNIGVAPTLSVGQLGWNSTDQTIDIQTTLDTTLQVGQEQVMLVENKSGAAIQNGKVVYVSGTTGGSGKLNVALAAASSVNSETAFIIGVATQNINDNSTGFVTTFGKVNGIPLPTAQFADGDIAYLGDTPGELRNYKPSKPSHGSFQMGRVIRAHDANGILFVTIRGSVDMSEIHDVASSTPSNGQVLVWNTASGLYEPKNADSISGITNYATTASLNNYVLTSTNLTLSNAVTGHLASAVHWDANTLDARFVNASGDSVTGSFFFGNLSATNFSATNYLNLPSVTALNGTGIFEVTSYSRSNYVLTSTNLALSNAVTGHLASAVHWDADTLDARFINASGDNVTGVFTFGSVTGTNIFATTYLNLPSALATWNASALQGRAINNAVPSTGDLLAWDSANSRWTPSSVPTGGVTNNPGGSDGYIQFKNGGSFSGVAELTYNSTLSSLYARSLSSLGVTATNISATTYSNLPSVTALNGTGVFEVTSYSRSNYVLTSTNLALSNTVTGHLASAVHWDLTTLNANYINASGDSVTGSFFFGNLSSTNFSATTYLNLPSVTALNGTGVFELTSYSRSNYVLTSTNLALSNTVTGHLASAVHWDLATLNSNYINASGDNVAAAFTFGNVTGTNFSATTYLNLPSGTPTWNANKLSGTTISFQDIPGINPLSDNDTLVYTSSFGSLRWINYPISLYSRNLINPYVALSGLSDVTASINPTNGQSLVWSSTKWVASSVGGGTGGGSNFNATAIQGVPVCATAPTTNNQAFVYDSANTRWKPGYTIYQSTAIPSNGIGANGDIYFQYDQSSTLSGLGDVQVISTPTTGQVLAWNSSKWVPSSVTAGGAAAVGSNYRFQFYNDGSLSSANFGYDPNTYGGSISSTIPVSLTAWAYIDQNLGLGSTITFYGAGGANGYLQVGPASSVSANAYITPSLSAVTISATTYRNLPTSALSGLSDSQITTTPALSSVLKWNGSKWVAAVDATGTSTGGTPAGTNYEFQFYNNGNFSAVQGIEYSPDFNGSPQFILSGNVPKLYVENSIYTQNMNAGTQLGVYSQGGQLAAITSPQNGILAVGVLSGAILSSTLVSSTSSIADIYDHNISILTATSITLPDTCVDKMFISCVSNTTVVLPAAPNNAGRALQFIKSDTSGWPITISSVYLNTATSSVRINIPRDVVNVISNGTSWFVENTRQVYGHGRSIYFDDFLTGNNETGEVGDLRWAFVNGTLDFFTPTATLYNGDYIGMMRRSSAATINQIATLTLDATGNRYYALTKDYLELRMRTAVSGAVTSYKYRVGLIGSDMQSSGIPTQGIYFETSGGNWLAVTVANGIATITDTGFSDVTGLHTLRIFQQENGNVEFYIDDIFEALHTTNLPNRLIGLGVCAQLIPLSASARSYVMDYYGFCVVNRSNTRYL